MGAMNARSLLLSRALAVALASCALVLCVPTIFYVLGNGLGGGALALAGLPLSTLLGAALLWSPSLRVGGVLAAVLVGEVLFAALRMGAVESGPPIAYALDGDTGVPPPLLSRLVREPESTRAGVALTRSLGFLDAPDAALLDQASGAQDQALARMRKGSPGPNALLLRSDESHVQELLWLPEGDGPFPAIVFLHGWGGLLSTYLSALAGTEVGRRYAIVAPALDWQGAWWEDPGWGVVVRTLDTLPPSIDRSRLFLVGLSNGATGATRLSTLPSLASRFLGTVLLVGVGWVEPGEDLSRPMLVLPGERDNRFPLELVQQTAEDLRARGLPVTCAPQPGDHFNLFTHTDTVAGAMLAWMEAVEEARVDPGL